MPPAHHSLLLPESFAHLPRALELIALAVVLLNSLVARATGKKPSNAAKKSDDHGGAAFYGVSYGAGASPMVRAVRNGGLESVANSPSWGGVGWGVGASVMRGWGVVGLAVAAMLLCCCTSRPILVPTPPPPPPIRFWERRHSGQ